MVLTLFFFVSLVHFWAPSFKWCISLANIGKSVCVFALVSKLVY